MLISFSVYFQPHFLSSHMCIYVFDHILSDLHVDNDVRFLTIFYCSPTRFVWVAFVRSYWFVLHRDMGALRVQVACLIHHLFCVQCVILPIYWNHISLWKTKNLFSFIPAKTWLSILTICFMTALMVKTSDQKHEIVSGTSDQIS